MIELSYDPESRELPSAEMLSEMERDAAFACSARGIAEAEISLTFVPPDEMRRMNAAQRGVDAVTDVLSFPQSDDAGARDSARGMCQGAGVPLLLGDIVICTERAYEQADEYGHGIERELRYLFVHGLLHLLGYDHEHDEDRARMRAEEERVIAGRG
ncbi:MAG: rRNA maturation RNase YbeY [Clostridiales Family XIII bacterium]|jgi:probable rRNA maturation factor|nr:rRNA maturation RNase YbeY [Clostridiales Family XIII bacterium]